MSSATVDATDRIGTLDEQDVDVVDPDRSEEKPEGGANTERRRGRSRRRSSRPGGITPAQARKAVRVVATMRDADDRTIDVASAIIGSAGSGRDDLAVAVLTGKAQSTRALGDLSEIADADPTEAAVIAGMLPKSRLKSAWELLRVTGSDLPVELPDADVKAAIAVARAVHDRDDGQVETLERAAELLRK